MMSNEHGSAPIHKPLQDIKFSPVKDRTSRRYLTVVFDKSKIEVDLFDKIMAWSEQGLDDGQVATLAIGKRVFDCDLTTMGEYYLTSCGHHLTIEQFAKYDYCPYCGGQLSVL